MALPLTRWVDARGDAATIEAFWTNNVQSRLRAVAVSKIPNVEELTELRRLLYRAADKIHLFLRDTGAMESVETKTDAATGE